MTVFPDVFTEMAVLLLFAAAVGALGVRLRQPLIVAFIAVGIMVGPSVLGWVSANDQVDLLAKFGITLLLFVVGLKLDLHIIRTMGPVALATGLGQVIFTSVVGYLIGYAFGMTPVTALYVAVALTFSSTIIIVKLLSDKREVDTLHGRIAGSAVFDHVVGARRWYGRVVVDRRAGGGMCSDRQRGAGTVVRNCLAGGDGVCALFPLAFAERGCGCSAASVSSAYAYCPELIEYPLRLPCLSQVTMINITSLLPGTLNAGIEGQVLKVHVLDGRGEFLTGLKEL